jgi:hypothetical protein
VWQQLGVEQIQNGGRCHGNQSANNLQSNSGRHPTPLFWYLGFHGNFILNFINTPKLPHTTVNIPTMFHEVL